MFNGCRRRARQSGMRCGHEVLAIVLLLVLGPMLVHAADESASPPYSSFFVQETLSRAGMACANAPEGPAATDCLVGQALNNVVMEQVSRFANEQGRSLFGEHFSIANRLRWSSGGTGLGGDIDAVFPLSFGAALAPVSTASDEPGAESNALFLQWGVSRWTDDKGMRRDDMRYGLVRRFALSDTPGADVVGVSALLQRGLESGHERLVTGLDYAGTWGNGWFHHYMPTTGWRPGRSGFEERALEGAELGLRLTPTTTIGLETALTRWEDRYGSGDWSTGARVGLDWRPHPWLSFRAAWEDTGDSDGSASFGVRFSMPLGGGHRERPRWKGLGLSGGGTGSEADAPDIWRPLDNVGPIQFAERAIPAPPPLPSPQAVDAEECQAGQTVRPGESCAYPGTALEFTVLASGSGRLGFFTSGRSLNIVNTTINGQRITFVANRQDDGSWLIERVGDSASGGVPELEVGSASVSDANPDAGASFTLRATVRNAGVGRSAATTLRYYRSTDATISTSDTEVGTVAVGGLAASGTSAESIDLTAPSSAGTYYYGACVDTVSGESDTENNCSDAVAVTVSSGGRPGDTAPHFHDTVPAQSSTAGTVARALTLPAATGGDGALTYTLEPAVPGLSFDAATRRLSGRPTQAGTYPMTYRAADADANTADSDAAILAFTLTVQAAGDFAPRMFGTVAAQTYTAGTAVFALRLPTAYGGNGALTYTLAPAVPGLSFDAATRRLSGTPTQAGTYPMTYRAADADANTADSDATIRTFTLTVQAAGDFAPRMFGTVAAQTYTSGTAIVPVTLLRAFGGNGALTYTLAPAVPGLSFDAATRRLSGTPTQAGTYPMTYRAADADANTADSDAAIRTFTLTVQATPGGVPDLVVGSASVSDASPDTDASFTLRATVRNAGDGRSAATTLRYYRSSDATISTSDTEVGTDAVSALAGSGTNAESVSLTAPSSAGTYYYGACVDTVAGESDTTNNCSSAVRVTVHTANDALAAAEAAAAEAVAVEAARRAAAAAAAAEADRRADEAVAAEDAQATAEAAWAAAEDAQADAVNRADEARDAAAQAEVAAIVAQADADQAQAAADAAPADQREAALEAAVVARAAADDAAQRAADAQAAAEADQAAADAAAAEAALRAADALTAAEAAKRAADALTAAEAAKRAADAAAAEAARRAADAAQIVADIVSGRVPELVVESASVSDANPDAGASFTLRATVRNAGVGRSAATTLRYYRSTDATISTSDTEVGTVAVGGLAASGTSAESIDLTAPSSAGTYYYGACVDTVSGESDTENNCSDAVAVTVSSGGRPGDTAPHFHDTVPAQSSTAGTVARALTLPAATGGDGALTYTLEPAVPGLSFDAATRRLSGRPTQAGTYPMTYRAADADANTADSDAAILAFTLTVQAAGDFAPRMFGTVAAQTYTAGTAVFALRLPTAYGGNGALTYTLAPAVPGLSFDAATRRLSGTPTQAGTYPMTYRAADADANTADSDAAIRTFTLTVQAAGDFAPRMFGTVAAQTYTSGTAIVPVTLLRAFGGNGALTYTLAPAVPGLSFDAATRRLSGTPTQAGTYPMTYRAADADANTADSDAAIRTFTLTVQATPGGVPDLVVGSASVSDASPDTDASFTLRATVRNAGDGRSAATTLRYYRSSDATISTSDTEVGTDAVSALAGSGTNAESVSLTAPSSAGTYYYGACVDTVAGESDTTNNCSSAVRVTVSSGGSGGSTFGVGDTIPGFPFGGTFSFGRQLSLGGTVYTCRSAGGCEIRNGVVTRGTIESGGGTPPPSSAPDLAVGAPSVSDASPDAGASFTLRATVRNAGAGRSAATTLRYYRSSDATISKSDTAVGTDAVSALAASGTSAESISLTAPSSAGTYYYGACVDAVSGESDTTNNCSSAVRVTVSGGVAADPPPSPTNLRLARVGSSIRVSWDTSLGATHYEVWRCNDSVGSCSFQRYLWRRVASRVTATTWLDTDPPRPAPGITVRLRYIVQACNSAGCSGQLR